VETGTRAKTKMEMIDGGIRRWVRRRDDHALPFGLQDDSVLNARGVMGTIVPASSLKMGVSWSLFRAFSVKGVDSGTNIPASNVEAAD
jgi:hypothetical protein